MGFDFVLQYEIGSGIWGPGGGELLAERSEGVGAPGRGERVEADVPGPGRMSPDVVRASRIRA